MKVLQITAVYASGSVGKISKVLHENLLKNGNESFVCCGVKPNTKTRNVFVTCNKFLRGINKARYYLTGMNLCGSNISTRKIIFKIKKIKPDIVHIHCLNDYYLNPHKLFKFLARNEIKTVITMHCEHYYTGSCGNALKCNKWKEGGCQHCYQVKISRFPLIDKSKKMFVKLNNSFSLFKNKNLYFCPCTPWLEDRAKKSIILSKFTNFYPILNGADTNIYKNYRVEKNTKTILFVSPRFNDPIKGAAKINDVAEQFHYENITIKLVGNIPNDFKLNKKIIKVGPKYNIDLAKEYSSADVTLLLSEAECFPMVIVESLLCGTKVVSFKCGGPENCYPTEFVSFVEQNDFTAMKREISRLLSENYSKTNVSNFAKNLVSEEIMFNNYNNVYSIMMKKN